MKDLKIRLLTTSLYGDKIVGFDTNDFPITWFYPLGEKKVERITPKLENN